MHGVSLSAVGLVGLVGTISQTGGLALLVVLFTSLGEHARRTSYFPRWRAGWVAALVALMAVMLRYSPIPSPFGPAFWSLPESDARVRVLYLVYESSKLLFLALLATGTRTFVHGRGGLPSVRATVLASLASGAVIVATCPTLNMILLVQVAIAVPIFAWSGWLLLSLPARRRSWGSSLLGVALAGHAVLWATYGVGFAWSVFVDSYDPHNPLHLLLTYNSFIDLFGGMLLGYTMVNVLMEDATRVIAAAHGELAAAHDQLRRLALFDPLTGALNRRAFVEGVGLDRARASFGAVAMLDVDNLKPVNDAYGHATGDALLCHLVGSLSPALRATDKFYRWGGDEFLIVMPSATTDDARSRLASLVRQMPPLAVGPDTVTVRVSVGITRYLSGDELMDAVQEADRAMYEIKTSRHRPRHALPATVRANAT